MRRIILVALAALVCATALQAEAVFTFYGRTGTFSPSFHRFVNPAETSTDLVRYEVLGFYPNRDATCSIYSTQEGDTYDGHITLYRSSFDPAAPLANVVGWNDDFMPSDGGMFVGTSAIQLIDLEYDYNYWLVTSGYNAADYGSYSVTITCQDPATRVLPATPYTVTIPSVEGQYQGFRNGRFVIWADWRDFEDHTGQGTFVPFGSADSGIIWFFDKTNFEVLIKVLNGCGLNNRYWVFYAATTNVEFNIYVYDTERDVLKQYHNNLGVSAAAKTDTSALATCP